MKKLNVVLVALIMGGMCWGMCGYSFSYKNKIHIHIDKKIGVYKIRQLGMYEGVTKGYNAVMKERDSDWVLWCQFDFDKYGWIQKEGYHVLYKKELPPDVIDGSFHFILHKEEVFRILRLELVGEGGCIIFPLIFVRHRCGDLIFVGSELNENVYMDNGKDVKGESLKKKYKCKSYMNEDTFEVEVEVKVEDELDK